jgi:hypothetical protein
MAPRHLRHHSAGLQRLRNDPGLVVRRPPAPAARAVGHLEAANLPLRLKRKLKSRHEPISAPDSPRNPLRSSRRQPGAAGTPLAVGGRSRWVRRPRRSCRREGPSPLRSDCDGRRWHGDQLCQLPQVLGCGGEVELVRAPCGPRNRKRSSCRMPLPDALGCVPLLYGRALFRPKSHRPEASAAAPACDAPLADCATASNRRINGRRHDPGLPIAEAAGGEPPPIVNPRFL